VGIKINREKPRGLEKESPNLSVKLGSLRLKNPVMAASGTFGYGEEYNHLIPLKKLGAIITKGLSREPRKGNAPPVLRRRLQEC